MTRVFNVYFPNRTLLLALSEASLIFLALITATYAGLGNRTPIILQYGNGVLKIALACAICLLCMYYYDLYDSLVLTNPREVVTRLVQVLGTVCLILAFLYYTYPAVGLDARVSLLGVVLAGLFLTGTRRLFFALSRSVRLAEHAVLLGDGPLATALAAEIEKHPEIGVRLKGYLGNGLDGDSRAGGLRRLGGAEDLAAVIDPREIRRVIITMADRRGNLPVEALLQLKTRGVLVQDGADVYEAITGKVPVDSLRLSWLLFSPGFRVSRSIIVYKRVCGILLSAIGLVLCLPAMVVIALAIWIDSGRPIIFRQTRIGKDGKPFTLYKFRSMYDGADRDESLRPAQANDERCTRVGRWLRRTRLDELPQFYNILHGDMSFVGPRPFVPVQERECVEKIPFYSQRWVVKPGATGWAQVHRGYCDSLHDNADKLAYDLFYIKHLSVGLDLLIVFQTLKILLLGRGGR